MSQMTLSTRMPRGRLGKMLSTKRGTIALGTAAALLAAVLLVAYLSRYRESVTSGMQEQPVLVATRLIAKGSPVSIIEAQGSFKLEQIARDHLKDGAVADPDALEGRIAVEDIAPGQQLTVGDFTASRTNAVQTKVTGRQRAVSVEVPGVNGMEGLIRAGDRVDIYVAATAQLSGVTKPVVKLLLPNVPVMSVPSGEKGSYYVLKLGGQDVAKLTFAAENATLRFVARPTSGAKEIKPQVFTMESLLFGGPKGS